MVEWTHTHSAHMFLFEVTCLCIHACVHVDYWPAAFQLHMDTGTKETKRGLPAIQHANKNASLAAAELVWSS